jgi:hypothetical protein
MGAKLPRVLHRSRGSFFFCVQSCRTFVPACLREARSTFIQQGNVAICLAAGLGHFALVLFMFLSQNGGMHPPLFRQTHRLSDWPECVIELH